MESKISQLKETIHMLGVEASIHNERHLDTLEKLEKTKQELRELYITENETAKDNYLNDLLIKYKKCISHQDNYRCDLSCDQCKFYIPVDVFRALTFINDYIIEKINETNNRN